MRRRCLILFIPGVLSLVSLSLASGSRSLDPARLAGDPPADDVTKIVGPERCGECHQSELEAWKMSGHARGFQAMHKKPEARAIAKKLGIRRIKTAKACVGCHYTPKLKRDRIQARCGVSCESCHGPAADWIELHSTITDIEGRDAADTTRLQKTSIDQTIASGMRRADHVYDLIARCHECHTVRDEKLVNDGGHPSGKGFEFLSWSQGEVRHNYLGSAGAENEKPTAARRRLFFALGQITKLRFSLLGLAGATHEGSYRSAMLGKTREALRTVEAINKALADRAEIQAIVNAATLNLESADAPTLERAATAVDRHARSFASREDGSRLAAIDSFLPPAQHYRGSARK